MLPADRAALRRRVAAAAVLVPATIAAVWAGGIVWAIVVTILAAIALWEWGRMTGGQALMPAGAVALAAAAGALVFAVAGPCAGLVEIALCGAVAAIVGLLGPRGWRDGGWASAGAIYIGLSALALVWLRATPGAGFNAILWLLVAVWAADSTAYLAGKWLGGPRLAPSISPGKTWAGLIGSVIGAVVIGLLFGWWWPGAPEPIALGGFGVAVGLIGQAGDLLESGVKRHFGLKDTGALIPGHGGILDRVDALMAVVLVVAALYLIDNKWLTWS